MNKFFISLILGLLSSSMQATVFLALVENNTENTYFKYFGEDQNNSGAFLLSPQTIKQALDFTSLEPKTTLSLMNIQGEESSIFLKQEVGEGSGTCSQATRVPAVIGLWRDNPSAFDEEKRFIRYCLTEEEGFFGMRINEDEEPMLFAIKGLEFLD